MRLTGLLRKVIFLYNSSKNKCISKVLDEGSIYTNGTYYSSIAVSCDMIEGMGTSEWIVEGNTNLTNATCVSTSFCTTDDIQYGKGVSIYTHRNHIGNSFDLSEFVSIESSIRASCIQPGTLSYPTNSMMCLKRLCT